MEASSCAQDAFFAHCCLWEAAEDRVEVVGAEHAVQAGAGVAAGPIAQFAWFLRSRSRSRSRGMSRGRSRGRGRSRSRSRSRGTPLLVHNNQINAVGQRTKLAECSCLHIMA
jgi:hypothetical protein